MGSGCTSRRVMVVENLTINNTFTDVSSRNTSRSIDRKINADKQKDKRTIKMLLLGTGECGKSTVLKQIKILHSEGFSAEDLREFKALVHLNILESMSVMTDAVTTMQLQYKDHTKAMSSIERVESALERHRKGLRDVIEPETTVALQYLWAHESCIGTVFARRNELQLHDSSKYFLDDLQRVTREDYLPSTEDVLQTRAQTTGIHESLFKIKAMTFKVIDVGGQRSERRKWLHCFDSVNALIFISAISEFDQLLAEDETQNRLTESLLLFASLLSSPWFSKSAVILFLNKTDLFRQKLESGRSIKSLFPAYSGPSDSYDDSIMFLKTRFIESAGSAASKRVFAHETCATKTNQVQLVIDGVIDAMISKFMGVTS